MNAQSTIAKGLYNGLKRESCLDLSRPQYDLLRRLLVLTKTGSKPCDYSNKTGSEEFAVSERTIMSHFKKLVDAGYISTLRGKSERGDNVRIVTINLDKLPELKRSDDANASDKASNAAAKTDLLNDTQSAAKCNEENGQTILQGEISREVSGEKQGEISGENLGEISREVSGEKSTISREVSREVSGEIISREKIGLRLLYNTLTGESPFYIDNREKIRKYYSVLRQRTRAPLANLTNFDLAPLAKHLPFELKPFGQSHDFKFDFSAVYQKYCYSSVMNAANADPSEWHAFSPSNMKHWREYFIFCVLIELSCFADQCFLEPEKLDPFGKNLDSFYFEHQYGLLFTILNTAYASNDPNEYDGMAVFKGLKHGYAAGRGSLLNYCYAHVSRNVLSVLNDPVGAQCAFEEWRYRFFKYANLSYRVETVKFFRPSDPRYAASYFDADIARFLLCDERGFAPRLCMPLLMFRRIVTMHGAARMTEEGPNQYTLDRVKAFAEVIHSKPEIINGWRCLCDNLADLFPFMSEGGAYECV